MINQITSDPTIEKGETDFHPFTQQVLESAIDAFDRRLAKTPDYYGRENAQTYRNYLTPQNASMVLDAIFFDEFAPFDCEAHGFSDNDEAKDMMNLFEPSVTWVENEIREHKAFDFARNLATTEFENEKPEEGIQKDLDSLDHLTTQVKHELLRYRSDNDKYANPRPEDGPGTRYSSRYLWAKHTLLEESTRETRSELVAKLMLSAVSAEPAQAQRYRDLASALRTHWKVRG